MTGPGCGTHAGLGTELRAVAVLLLDRIGPVLERARADGPPQSAATCAVCTVCAAVALLRGERPELAVRLAEHAAGFLEALQSALDVPAESPSPPPAPSRRVQHIHVERPAARC
jgi:hypothetical protein